MRMTWARVRLLLLFIIVLGAILRFSGLGTNSFVADEFLDINSSYGYLKTGEWKAWDFNDSKPADVNVNDARDERAYVYKWQVAQVFKFFPPTEGVARSVSALWGVFTILVMFWTGWFYTRKKTIGLLAAFLFAVSMNGIIFDRRLRMYAMFFPVYLGFATSLFAFFESEYRGKLSLCKKLWKTCGLNFCYFIPLILLGALSFLTHQLSVSIVPTFGAYLAWMVFATWRKGESPWNKYVITLGAGLLAAVTVIVLSSSARLLLFGGALVWFENHYSYFGHVLHDFQHPLLGLLSMVLGGYVLHKNLGRSREAAWLTLGILVPFVMAVWLWNRNAGAQYIFFTQSFGMLLSACGIYGVMRFVKEKLPAYGKHGAFGALGLALLLLPNYGYFFWVDNTYHETNTSTNPNYRKVFMYFKKYQEAGDVLITRNFRNYYLSGAEVLVFDFGGELAKEKFSLAELQAIMAAHPHGWVIVSTNDYDYISNDTEQYIKKNMELVSNAAVRGDIEVYRWGALAQ